MSKSIKLTGGNYWDTSSITHDQQSLKTYLGDRNFARRITTNGARNYWYYLGKVRKVTSGSGNVGRIVYFFNNWENYNQSVPAIVTLTKGKINICVLGEPMSASPNWKQVYEYEDADYYYFYLWTPTYHDAWQSWVLEEYAADMSEVGSRYSDADFSTLVTNKGITLLRHTSIPSNYKNNIVAANFSVSEVTMSGSAWSRPQIPFGRGSFNTTNSDFLSQNGNQVYIKVSGTYRIDLSYHTSRGTNEADSYLGYGGGHFVVANYSPQAQASIIRYLPADSYVTADINTAATSWTIYNATLTVTRLSD